MHHDDPPTIALTPALLSAIRSARAFDDAATTELERLSEAAESFADYRYRDERSADFGELAREHLGVLLHQLGHIQ